MEISALLSEDRGSVAWLLTVLAESGDRKEEPVSKRERLPVSGLGINGVDGGESEHLGLRFIPPSNSARNSRRQAQKSDHGISSGHLLQGGDEEADLHLIRML